MHKELGKVRPEQQYANLPYSHCQDRMQFSQHQNNNSLLDLNNIIITIIIVVKIIKYFSKKSTVYLFCE